MTQPDRRQRSELRRELEPHILPRQLQALERVAIRLASERPRPDPGFRAALDARVEELAGGDGHVSAGGAPWRLQALVAVVLGVVFLLVAIGLAL